MKIALFSAFPHELTHVKKNSRPVMHATPFPLAIKTHRDVELLIVETGMGLPNLEAAFTYVLNGYRPDIILSLGFGGALYYRADIGELVFASRYFFLTHEGAVELPQLAFRNACHQRSFRMRPLLPELKHKIAIKEGSFVTLSAWTSKAKLKPLIPEGIPFPVCDRETVHLAKLSYIHNLPFYAVRAITDTLDEDIPEELFGVTDVTGNYSISRAVGLLMSRPSLIPESLKLGRNAARASRNLGQAVTAFAEVISTAAPSFPGRIFSGHARK